VAQQGHWFGPVTGLGWLGLAQPMRLSWVQPQKHKKIEKYVYA